MDPGTGVLTKYLIESGRNITAVEVDQEAVNFLESAEFAPKINLVKGDFFKNQPLINHT